MYLTFPFRSFVIHEIRGRNRKALLSLSFSPPLGTVEEGEKLINRESEIELTCVFVDFFVCTIFIAFRYTMTTVGLYIGATTCDVIVTWYRCRIKDTNLEKLLLHVEHCNKIEREKIKLKLMKSNRKI